MPTFPTRGHRYDVIVVGAGIAGSEAAYACARGGLDTLLVTTSLDTVYNTVGDRVRLAPPEGTLMRSLWEEHAGPDGCLANARLHRAAKYALERQDGLHLLQSNVTGLRLDDRGAVDGVDTWEGVERLGRPVALCVGSFLDARLTVGSLTEEAGRLGEMAYGELYQDLVQRGMSFRDVRLSADPAGGALPYEIRCRVLEPSGVGGDGFRVPGVPGLYAAGLCARGYLPFEEAALDGVRLGRALLAARSRR
ncbi:MAG: FAD-dependent oxidoreductase [Deinococcales bacterium]